MAIPLTILCLALASPALAQIQGGVFTKLSSNYLYPLEGYGQSVALIQDVNFDGHTDVLIGAPNSVSFRYKGAVRLQAGGGSTYRKTYYGRVEVDGLFGWSVADAGFVSGGTVHDILVGAPGEDRAYVVDTILDTYWLTLDGPVGSSFGWSVASLGDLNSDGADDFAVGAPNASPNGLTEAGSVFVYSGADGSLLQTFDGAEAGGHFGYALTSLQDTSANPGGSTSGSPAKLLAIGAPDTALGGYVAVHDAFTGALTFSASGSVLSVGSSFGYALAALSDTDADGIEELAVAAPHYATGAFGFNVGKVEVFSTGSGLSLYALTGDDNFNIFGTQICGADIDGDGITELVVRSFKSAYGQIELFSGVNNQLLFEIEGTTELPGLGTSMVGGADITGEGFPDLVLGAPLTRLMQGKVLVYGIHPVLTTDQTTLDASTGGFMEFQIDFPAEEKFRRYLLLASGGTGPIIQDGVVVPLSNDRILNLMNGSNPALSARQGTLSRIGDAQVAFFVPRYRLLSLVGRTLYFAAISADSDGVRASSVAVPVEIITSGSGEA